ncbi:MAG: type II/IV secretion system ATPase subunit [Thaumarchaeota archaeon]|nr:type II/IV secretion system ATPase subunit [Nitrososphaerota archaeon]
MKISFKLTKNTANKLSEHVEKTKKRQIKEKAPVEGPMVGYPIPKNFQIIERYTLAPPFAYAVIAEDPSSKLPYYFVDELELTDAEKTLYNGIISVLQTELKAPREEVNPKKYFAQEAQKIVDRYRMMRAANVQASWAKILYYAGRDMVGFGAIDPFMQDQNIEDISVDGAKKPVYVYHRKYESLETNLVFTDEQKLDDAIVRLVHMSGKHVSTAFPVVDATLPGRHRLASTFRREVSPQGSTMTIRKFRADPITIVDLINFGVLDYAMAAYAWLLIENRATAIVVGATASGKTTFLNALLSMINPNSKIVTIEEVQEINIHHTNWAPLVSRLSYGISESSIGEISLFNLVKTAMRMRPDIMIVGEVRGEEAYALFQAISTGHGGLATLHAEDAGSAIQRLTSKPMDVAPSYVNFLDLIFSVRRVAIPNPNNPGSPKIVRRVISVDEVLDSQKWVQTFAWEPQRDKFFESMDKSVKLRKYAKDFGKSMKDVSEEIENRVLILQWLRTRNIRNYIEISTLFSQYHNDPEMVLNRIRLESIRKSGLYSKEEEEQTSTVQNANPQPGR